MDVSILMNDIFNKYNEWIENSISEMMDLVKVNSIKELRAQGYDIKLERFAGSTKTKVSLWYGEQHILTYEHSLDPDTFSIVRKPLVNKLEGIDEDVR